MRWKSLGVFILAYGGGLIAALILTPIVSPYLTFLNITLYQGITALTVLLNGAITFFIAAFLFKGTHTDIDG